LLAWESAVKRQQSSLGNGLSEVSGREWLDGMKLWSEGRTRGMICTFKWRCAVRSLQYVKWITKWWSIISNDRRKKWEFLTSVTEGYWRKLMEATERKGENFFSKANSATSTNRCRNLTFRCSVLFSCSNYLFSKKILKTWRVCKIFFESHVDGAKRGEKEYACKVLNIGYQNRIGWGFSYRISDTGRDIGDTLTYQTFI